MWDRTENALLEVTFAELAIVTKALEASRDGPKGDPFFDELLPFACRGRTDAVINAARLAVSSHLSETCNVIQQ